MSSSTNYSTAKQPVAWKCAKTEHWSSGDGGVITDAQVIYAKTRTDMLILKHKGYSIEPIYDDEN